MTRFRHCWMLVLPLALIVAAGCEVKPNVPLRSQPAAKPPKTRIVHKQVELQPPPGTRVGRRQPNSQSGSSFHSMQPPPGGSNFGRRDITMSAPSGGSSFNGYQGSSRFGGSSGGFAGFSSRMAGISAGEAVRRVTAEIKDVLEIRPALAVWVLDRSDSAQALVREVGLELKTFYSGMSNLAATETAPTADGQPPLLTTVVTFGQNVQFPLAEPTGDVGQITAALDGGPADNSGREVTFSALKQALEKYLPFRTQKQRELVVVLVTDEAGDDLPVADQVVALAKKNNVPIHVIGVNAPFGSITGPNQSAEGKGAAVVGDWVPVRQGPETRAPMAIHLAYPSSGYGRGGSTEEMLESGLPPYSLGYITSATEGRFLAVSAASFGGGFSGGGMDPEVAHKYAPDYLSSAEYDALINGNKALRALERAAKLGMAEVLGSPSTNFTKRDEASFKRELDTAQRDAARLQPAIDELYEVLREGEGDRLKLTSPRWQASFDTAMGRALAAKSRVDGYNTMLALLKQGRNFTNPNASTWILEPAETSEAGSTIEKMIEKSREYLNRVVKDHPNTPWADMAQRELSVPLGWKWTER